MFADTCQGFLFRGLCLTHLPDIIFPSCGARSQGVLFVGREDVE